MTTTRTDDQMALELASKYEGLRMPCLEFRLPGWSHGDAGNIDHVPNCVSCAGRGWLSNPTTDALLLALDAATFVGA